MFTARIWFCRIIFLLLCEAIFGAYANAQKIDYLTTNLGGSAWRYDYVLSSPTGSVSFDEWTIYFDPTEYASLVLDLAPVAWNPLVIQPDTEIPASGYLDVISPGGPIGDGAFASGFSVSFLYLGSGTPGAQTFEGYDSSSFALLFSGKTQTSAVPEPSPLLLIFVSTIAFAVRMGKLSPARP